MTLRWVHEIPEHFKVLIANLDCALWWMSMLAQDPPPVPTGAPNVTGPLFRLPDVYRLIDFFTNSPAERAEAAALMFGTKYMSDKHIAQLENVVRGL